MQSVNASMTSTSVWETNARIDAVRDEVARRIDDTKKRQDSHNEHMDRFYNVVVRREGHAQPTRHAKTVDREVAELKRKIAA